jgi:hypothetical protein
MPMATATTMNRSWIADEFSKGVDAERVLIEEARAHAESPPDPSLGVVYHEITAAAERHLSTVETIATRYGHTPSRSLAGGIGETLGRLRDKVGALSTTPLQQVGHDLASLANAIHWTTAWIQAFENLGDAESARELSALLVEQKAHRDALQGGLNRMVLQGAAEAKETT